MLALTENLERADLTPMEEARAMANYLDYTPSSEIENYQMIVLKTQKKGDLDTRIEKLAKKIPPEKNTVYRRLKLLDFPLISSPHHFSVSIGEVENFYRLKTKFLWSDRKLAVSSTSQYEHAQISRLIALNKLPKEMRESLQWSQQRIFIFG